MLERIKIENFRCLRKVDVPLRPLTVLIGPNDSGKSAFLMALHYLAHARNLDPFDWWRGDRSVIVSVDGLSSTCRVQRSNVKAPKVTPSIPSPLEPIGLFQPPSTGVVMESPGFSDEKDVPQIGLSCENVPGLFDYLLRRDRTRFFSMVDAMRMLVDGLKEIEIATPRPESRRVDVVVEDGFRLPADKCSVGVRLMLFFVALAYHPFPPKFILIEEPENGIHPKGLENVIRLLRDITKGQHGDHSAQIVLTTHSPHLLDYVDIEKDQVLVFRRNDDGSRTAEPADAERLKTFLDEFMLGEVWYNEGEAGLVEPAK